MLDRNKVLRDIAAFSKALFVDYTQETKAMHKAWKAVLQDSFFLIKVMEYAFFELPLWQGSLDGVSAISEIDYEYQVVAVDGSQLYPDKHQGTNAFLINIGSAVFEYGLKKSSVYFNAEPFLFLDIFDNDPLLTIASVDARREELELRTSFLLAQEGKKKYKNNSIALLDGPLIFSHLQTKESELKNYFLQSYMNILEQFYKEQILVIGYLSLPKNKEMLQLLKAQVTNFKKTYEWASLFGHMIDTMLIAMYVPVGHCSTFFKSSLLITKAYPEHLAPWFCYYVAPQEIVRIELPAYIVSDSVMRERALQMVVDQIKKGNGYPIALAEAHMQALVKHADRDFYYNALYKYSNEYHKNLTMSQKSIKKRIMSF